jgi:hypothetical protein
MTMNCAGINMKVRGVKFSATTEDGQIVTNFFWLDEAGKIVNTVKIPTRLNTELEKILSEGFTTELGFRQAGDGLLFLEALRYRYTGSYFRASGAGESGERIIWR